MYNIILDRLPTDYCGFLIRTDFRIGIQVTQALQDTELSEYQQIGTALTLLYGKGLPPLETAIKGLQWYMLGGKDKVSGSEEESNEPIFDFEIDASVIYSAFRVRYGIDLSRERLHWFEFLGLLGDLGDCAFTQIMEFRKTDLSKIAQGDYKNAVAKMKRRHRLPTKYTQEEQERIAEFMEMASDGL